MKDRRTFLKQASLVGLAGLLPTTTLLASDLKPNTLANKEDATTKWADGSRLVVSVSMQFEAGVSL